MSTERFQSWSSIFNPRPKMTQTHTRDSVLLKRCRRGKAHPNRQRPRARVPLTTESRSSASPKVHHTQSCCRKESGFIVCSSHRNTAVKKETKPLTAWLMELRRNKSFDGALADSQSDKPDTRLKEVNWKTRVVARWRLINTAADDQVAERNGA